MSKPRTLGVIPARGGSKRVPGKNARTLFGKPLLAYAIEAAQKSPSLSHFCVSTEDYSLAQHAIKLGAYVVKRPAELASDAATSDSVIEHALSWFGHGNYDIAICLHPTSPIRDPSHICEAIDLLWRSTANSLASVQCRKRSYVHNASIYAIKVPWFMQTGKLYDDNTIPYLMDKRHSVDIDDETDFVIAECLMQLGSPRKSTGSGEGWSRARATALGKSSPEGTASHISNPMRSHGRA